MTLVETAVLAARAGGEVLAANWRNLPVGSVEDHGHHLVGGHVRDRLAKHWGTVIAGQRIVGADGERERGGR